MDADTLTTSYDADTAVLTVTGEVDESTGPQLREELEKHSEGFTRDLVVDLGAVDYFPSLAVGVVAAARRRAEESGVDLELLATEGSVAQRVLTVCGLPHRTS
ncbi:STAS domain-containing protein [Nocardioides sp. SYSU D00038]|uniref:STAS domain-containing protein n=1 Tax=Nocardioides sp. SYSU D00038 TaxID=2812554 RepID=UPI001967924B|nr:STAS domain-containing protein [Nocardioides sp. SYSU D00038]